MKYIVAHAVDLDVLIEYVNQKFQQGYVCKGGIFADEEGYMQAMVKDVVLIC